ncbi:Oligopeptide ABC transporter, ATP-binding protein [Mycoplasmopsis bovigenitalium 51080]|uniref:Oligopeptide ABC transporter, ATP-binding protein n=1 Tax=Mycoplasmopsis bovigenitalium 51080 TaxID=1188235 RepID=N9V4K1_9BACT|nr:ATP-binding cassette domain-containing protein [Mycoplasmopsis bovigenitalium]ENY70242.1 Oligopeptide ABC transporter, ATP-binding protein [Mycoplasmopsis bovigenitalium 51080]
MKTNKPILEIQSLKKYFSNAGIVNKAVDDISFSVNKGEIVGLIGESGSGKTTVGRSLMRLYEDFNGFVTLDGKVISGRRISRSRTKFLRKNIQMIFQDPHASLNGQKNIYSTLKEPLIVNGIIKNKINDIFKDWVDIKEMYFYTFQKKYQSLELQNLKSINELAKDFFPYWLAKLQNYKIDDSISLEDNFNAYFGYLEQKQTMESQIVSNLYSNTDELMSFYYEKQSDFRNSNLELDESELKAAKDEYLKTLKLSKMSLKQYNSIKNISIWKQEISDIKKAFKEEKNTVVNTFNNFIDEFKKDSIIYRNAKLLSTNLDIYTHNLKNQLLTKKLRSLVKELKGHLLSLKYTQARELISEIQSYSKDFFTKHLQELKYSPELKNTILALINEKFVFDSTKWHELNKKNFDQYIDQINSLRKKIDKNSKGFDKHKKSATLQDVEIAKEKYEKAKIVNKQMLDEYVILHKKEFAQLLSEVEIERKEYLGLKDIQSETNALVEKAHKKFIAHLQENLKQLIQSKADKTSISEYSKLIKIYESKYKSKLLTLKSFEIEVKYLNKDIKAIKVLLGIDTDNAVDSKIIKFFKKISGNIIAKILISNLLIKTSIYKSLEDVGLLKQFAYRYPHEFSGGQRQRIVIARALITEPKVIVADEPIASLDISIQAQVVNLLKDLCEKKNIGMIFIAHDLSMIEYIANRVQIMHYGKIVESGDTQKVYSKPIHPYTINLFKAIPKISNANEKFENISFELDYFKGQAYPNIPELFKVEENHFIYGTQEQATEWSKPFGLTVKKVK